MKYRWFGALALAALMANLGTWSAPFVPPLAADHLELTYANFPPAGTFPCIQMERWKTEVEKRTYGAMTIKTFPGGTLLGAKAMMDGVIAGQADIGCLNMADQPGRFMITNATALPLGIPDARTGSLVLLDLYRKYQPAAFSKVKVLAMFTTPPTNILAGVAIRSLADLKGLDLRASDGAAQILAAWGANPVGMPLPATREALQKGVVKGLLSSLESLKEYHFAAYCSYITMTQTAVSPFAVVMNKERWDRLPPEVQKVMDDLITEQSEWTGIYVDRQAQEAVQWAATSHKLKIIQLSAAELAQWNQLLQPLTAEWAEEAKSKNLPAEAILADIKVFIQQRHR